MTNDDYLCTGCVLLALPHTSDQIASQTRFHFNTLPSHDAGCTGSLTIL